ncbi:hypothetical protein Ancab_038228 [Ancistrocladus abbreviatus]
MLLFPFLLLSSLCLCTSTGQKAPKIAVGLQGMFVFGSSIVDNGNNNYLPTLGKADYLPYGIDFPFGPTGRFSNGKNVADLLADLLKLPLVPPFLDPFTKGHRIIGGVNYGSGGAGILDDTGSLTGMVMNLREQINKFGEVTVPQLEALLNCTRRRILAHHLFLIAAGGNDYQFNYFTRNSNVSLETFTIHLLAAYSQRLKRLYRLGARKFVLLAINPIGCGPVARAGTPNNDCWESWNAAAQLFNHRLKSMVDCIKSQFSGSQFVVVNPYNIIKDIIDNAASRGFSNVTSACCELSITGILCKGLGRVCPNKRSYAYFDAQHSTEAVSRIIAAEAYASNNNTVVYPFNVKKLAQL